MKRRGFLGSLAAVSAAKGAVVKDAESSDPDEDAKSSLVTTPLVLMAPRPDGIEAIWGVSRLCHGWLEWKDESGSTGTTGMDDYGFVPQGDAFLRIRVRGWQPGATYSIRSVTISRNGKVREESEWKKVRTLDPASASTRVVVWNDTHEHEETIRKLQAVTPPADFLLWNGDTCNNWIKEDLLIPTLLNPAGQDISTGRPLLFTWGNHDVRGKWAFRMPGIVGTPSGLPYYAFRSGPVAMIFLHTGEDKPDAHPSFEGRVAFEQLRREQTAWLKEAIARPELRDAPYHVLFCHIPLRWIDESPQDYANGGFDRFSKLGREAWLESLLKWKTQMVVSGHTHHAQWMPATETFPFIQVTGGGPEPERATWIEIAADEKTMSFRMKNLEGTTLEEHAISPLA